MKKREFNNLKLRKRVISNLQQQHIQGGTDAITSATYIIITTIKILTEHVTTPRVCTTSITCPTPIPEPLPGTDVTTG